MGVIMTFCTFLLMDRLMVGREILTCCCTEEELPPEAFYPAGPPTLLVFDVLVVPVFSELARPLVPGGC
jgi:hypothetical protein